MTHLPEPTSKSHQQGPATDVSRRHNELLAAAEDATTLAYAPYSRFHVGAAVLTAKGEIVQGANVENASYGLTMCAERVAIFNALIADPGVEIRAIAIVQAERASAAPCGACRQVILEHGPDALVIYVGEQDKLKTSPITHLLPDGFWFPSGYGQE